MQQRTVTTTGPKLRRATLAVAVALALGGTAFSAQAQELNETLKALKTQMEQMQKQIERLEREQKQQDQKRADAHEKMKQLEAEQTRQAQAAMEREDQAAVPDNVITAGDTKNSFKLPGTDTSLSWGGYTKLDVIHNSNPATGASNFRNELYIPSTVTVGGTGSSEKDEIVMHAKESRIWFKSFTPTKMGALVTFIETDIFNLQSTDSERITNGNTPRLRHAFGKLGNLLAGQTWTSFMPVYTFPELNDFGGPAGQVFGRQAQVRWKQPVSWGSWQASLENPESTLDLPTGNGGGRAVPSDDRIPDMVVRADYKDSWGQASVGGLVRQLRADGNFCNGTGCTTINVDDETWGGAVMVAAKIKTFGDDYIKASAQYGALGRYQSYNAFPGGYVKSNGDIDTVDSFGAFAGYTHYWTPTLRSTWVGGYGEADNKTSVVGKGVTKHIWSSHLNLMWSPVPEARFGFEWLHANRELENGNDGNLDRLQLSAKYDF